MRTAPEPKVPKNSLLISIQGEGPEDHDERVVFLAEAIAGVVAEMAGKTDTDCCSLHTTLIAELVDQLTENGHGSCAVKILDMKSAELAALARENGIPCQS